MMPKIFLCPAEKKYDCKWRGSSDDIFDHFSRKHEDLLHFNESVNILFEVQAENHLLLLNAEIYLLQTRVTDEFLYIYLRFLGPARIASTLTYHIYLSKGNISISKENIEMIDGYFRVPLRCLYELTNDLNDNKSVWCKLVINENTISDYCENCIFDTEKSNDEIEPNKYSEEEAKLSFSNNSDQLYISVEHIAFESSKDNNSELSPNLQDLFGSCDRNSSPVELSENRNLSLNENDCDVEYESINTGPLLTRSQTFTSEEKKKHVVKRQASMRSLTSIAENDLDGELKCSNCNGHLAAPIFYCINEHNACTSCYQEGRVCSVCEKEITAKRNFELEQKSVDYIYTCVNNKNGCPKRLSFSDVLDHETHCTFCVYFCPIEECGFKGSFKYMVGHLSLIHSSVKLVPSFIAVFEKYQEIFLANESMGIFYCSWNLLDNGVVWKAKFCGPNARKFFCELKFKGKNFRKPLLLIKQNDFYVKEISLVELKEFKIKPKHSILTVTG